MSSNSSYPTFISNEAPVASDNSPIPPADSLAPASSTDPKRETNAGEADSKSEAGKEADRLYEERIEEEYAKREGGA
jgi:hypothetical protein